MKVSVFILALALCAVSRVAMAADDSPITSPTVATDDSPAALAAAKERGAATALKDIQAGTFRILRYGLPLRTDKPMVDDATGYRLQMVAGCIVSEPFCAEVEAYNRAMTEWHDKHK